jgi:hypothetical protein
MPNAFFLETVSNPCSEVLQCSLDCTFDIERGTINAVPSESRSGVVTPALVAVGMLDDCDAHTRYLLCNAEALSLIFISSFALLPSSCSCGPRRGYKAAAPEAVESS